MIRTRRRDETAELERIAQTAERIAVLLGAGVAPAAAWGHLAELGGADAERMREAADLVADGRPLAGLAQRANGAPRHPDDTGDADTAGSRRMSRGRRDATGRQRIASAGQARSDAVEGAWRALFAAWDVAVASGAPLGDGLHALAGALRGEAELRRAVAAELAGPRASARLVSWLPIAAIGLGALLGFDILGVLFGTPIGLACAAVGGGLLWAGSTWNRRLATRAERMPVAPGLELDLVAIAMSGGTSVAAARRLVRSIVAPLIPGAGDGDAADEVQRLAERAGAPVSLLLKADAARLRREARAAGSLRAAALGTSLMIPLGVCVLPAFGLLGVAPLLISVISGTLA